MTRGDYGGDGQAWPTDPDGSPPASRVPFVHKEYFWENRDNRGGEGSIASDGACPTRKIVVKYSEMAETIQR